MIKPSKSLCLFNNRCNEVLQQLEVVDAAIEVIQREIKAHGNPDEKIPTILKVSPKTYKALNVKAKQPSSILNRVRRNNQELALCRNYTHFGEYCKNLLRELYNHKPLLVVGKASGTLQYQEIVKLGSYNAIADFMVEQVFKRLEGERNTTKTIERLIHGTGVDLERAILDEAVAFFEVRHLLVHQSGLIDQAFYDRYALFLRVPSKVGSALPLTVGFARRGVDAIQTLVESIDSQLVQKGAIPPHTT
jgi:hypothetical protein